MAQAIYFLRSLVGQKILMALSGLIVFLFAIFHLLANLLIFAGREWINGFAALLEQTGPLLIIAEIVLLAAFLVHIASSVVVTWASWRARPVAYAAKKDIATTYAARTMILSGPLFLVFLVYHVMMLKYLVTGPGYSPTDIYGNLVAAFRVPAISIIYIGAMLLLGYHLYHGVWSMLQTVGLESVRYKRLRLVAAPVVAALVTAGYITIPMAVWIGAIK